ncbi:hypothetical protein DRN43_02425 [Thermococci archaeon]|nr:MAG: hypothetical protein DRN41_01935 [Thermococci archaeon]RLF90123.1 MAG: hypothetical protein DRN43_02425 [Thermococci archaeon]
MVRPFKVVILGKNGKGHLWEYAFLVFANSQEEAIKLAIEEVRESRNLIDARPFRVIEYKKPIVFSELKGGLPEEWVLDELDAIGGYENLPPIEV